MGHGLDFEEAYPDHLDEAQELEAGDELSDLERLLDLDLGAERPEDLAEVEAAVRSIQIGDDYSPKPLEAEPEPTSEAEPVVPEHRQDRHDHKVEVVIRLTEDKKDPGPELVEVLPSVFDSPGDDGMRGDFILGPGPLFKEKGPMEFLTPPGRRR